MDSMKTRPPLNDGGGLRWKLTLWLHSGHIVKIQGFVLEIIC